MAVLLLLQQRGQVTAAEVAAELEVSERTARRDLDALGMAGLPVYSLRGRNGGWRLAGGGRTDLSGLNADETRALFLMAAATSAPTQDLRAALRKLVRALPEPLRERAEAASGAIVVDPSPWDRQAPSPPSHLDDVQRAVIDGEQLRLTYVDRRRADSVRVVEPLGLAAKGSRWYLLAGTEAGLRTFRVDRIAAAEPTGQRVRKPDGFDLAEAWRLIVDEVDRARTPLVAVATVAADMVPVVRAVLGNRVAIGAARPDGRVEVEVRGHSVRALAGELAGFGSSLEIIGPPELRRALAEIGRQLSATYP